MKLELSSMNGVYNMMSKQCNELFKELFDYSDDECIMHEFVECIKYWVQNWHKGNIRICLIDLHALDNNFPNGDLYIGYDDMSGAMNTEIYTTYNFIEYIISIYNAYSDDLEPEAYWIDALNAILYD